MQSTNSSDARGTIAAMLALMALMMAAMLTMFVRQDEFRGKQVKKATANYKVLTADVEQLNIKLDDAATMRTEMQEDIGVIHEELQAEP